MSDITVTIKGFRNHEEAQEFINWYSGQGEQDITIWMECRADEGKDVSTSMNVDVSKTFIKGEPVCSDNNYDMYVKPM